MDPNVVNTSIHAIKIANPFLTSLLIALGIGVVYLIVKLITFICREFWEDLKKH